MWINLSMALPWWSIVMHRVVGINPGMGANIFIRYFLMLVATSSFSQERGLPVIFCVDFNHFKSIIMSALLYRKLWYAHLWTSLGCSSYATNENLIYSNYLYEFVTQTWLEYTKKWTGSPFLHMLPPGDLAH